MRRTAATPARWPATRGRLRRAAQRPLPSMMMATCSPAGCSLCTVKLLHVITSLCTVKLPRKKRLGSSGGETAEQGGCGLVFGYLGGISNHLFERGKIFEIALASGCRHAAGGLRAISIVILHDRHHVFFFQHLQVAAQ